MYRRAHVGMALVEHSFSRSLPNPRATEFGLCRREFFQRTSPASNCISRLDFAKLAFGKESENSAVDGEMSFFSSGEAP